MLLNFRFDLKKDHAQNIFIIIFFILLLKCYFCKMYTDVDLYGSRASSISEEEKIRRLNVIKHFSSYRHGIEKDWVETYHEIFSEQFDYSNEKKKLESSSSQDMSMSDSAISIRKNIDSSLQKNIRSCKSIDEMQVSSSRNLHCTMDSNTWSKTKDLKENKRTNPELNRRHNVVISFREHIPGLERGEYYPPKS